MNQLLYLAIEFLDELVFGAQGALMPLLQADFQLNYIQIGLLLSIPGYVSMAIEPILGILADLGKRRQLILAGGVFFAIALALTAISPNFTTLLASFILFFPASGAFVSLSQAAWMDEAPERREHNMARWTFAGSLGVVLGPLLLGLFLWMGATWRDLHWTFSALALLTLLGVFRYLKIPAPRPEEDSPAPPSFMDAARAALAALRRPAVLRWIILLEFSDLMLDVLLVYLALYFVNVAGVDASVTALAVAIWTGVGLLGDFLLIPLLERVSGLTYLRYSVILELALYPAFLLVPDLTAKLVILAFLGFFNSGWYAILQAELYKSMPNQSGTILVASNFGALIGKTLPLLIGFAAQTLGLASAMWILLLGPLALLVGIPRRETPAA